MVKILLCTDGGAQSKKAEVYTATLHGGADTSVTALYVVDPFLKKFTHEIYAVNREACRDHLDRSLEAEGRAAIDSFKRDAEEHKIAVMGKLRYGDPVEEILKEVEENAYDLVVMGSKVLKGWKERFESFKLTERVFKKCPIPLLVVR